MMDRPPGRIRPGGNVCAGQARPWRGACGLLGICLVAAMIGSATLTGRDPPVPDRPGRVGHAWLTATSAARQTISFGQPAGTSPGAPDTAVGALITLHATASSGLQFSFRSATPLVCTVSATIVTALTAGVCTITASQAGSAEFAAAPDVAHAFQIGTGTGQQTVRFAQPEGTQPGRPETMVGAHIP